MKPMPLANPTHANHHPKSWPIWLLLFAYLVVAVESLLVALVFKGTLLVLLAPAGVCWLKALDVWRELKKRQSAT